MSAIACPNCGKPLRPGAKFCGSCGATLPAGPPPRAAAAAAPPDSVACPHCGKPVRPGAKFCSNCGKVIEAVSPEAAATQVGKPPVSGPPVGAYPGPAPTLQGAAPPPSASRESPRPAAAAPPPPVGSAKTSRRGLTLVLLAVLLAGCALLFVGGYFAATRLGFLGASAGEGTATSSVAATAILTATATQSPATITPTVTTTITPTLTIAPSATLTPTQALAIAPAATSTSTVVLGAAPTVVATDVVTAAAQAAALLFEDTFDSQLSDNWVTWGAPIPTIDRGFNDRWLSLRSEVLTSGGVTSGVAYRIVNGPGTVIEFEGQLDNRYLNYAILMDWDQEEIRRGSETLNPGMIRVEVRAEAVTLRTLLTREACQAPVDAARSHTYRVEILEGQGVALYIDAAETPVCTIADMGIAALPGKVSFSGLGWVTRVKVMQRPVQ